MASSSSTTGIVFGGGGARTAYEAGAMRYLADSFPNANVAVMTGVGAGALNACLLAARPEPWPAPADHLVRFWSGLTPENVFRPRSLWDLVTQLMKRAPSPRQSLIDPSPLREQLNVLAAAATDGTLSGIRQNIEDGWLDTLVVPTTHYGALETVLWTQGQTTERFERARLSRSTTMTVDHLLAALSLALLYPAVSIDDAWYGAGVGLRQPFRPVFELGVDRVIALSTRSDDPKRPDTDSSPYPSPLQVASILSNTLLLDALPGGDGVAPSRSRGPADGTSRTTYDVDVLTMQPSVDLTGIADALDVDVDATLGTVIRYMHGDATPLPDLLSMLLFDPRYIRRLLLLGYDDARRWHEQFEQFLLE